MDAGIDSLEKLEIVVAVRRAPGGALGFAALRAASGFDRDDLQRALRQLAGSGFIADADADPVALAPRAAEEEALLDELVAIHARDRTGLIIAITEISLDRLRSLAGRAFADAFVIRKKSGDDDDR